MVVGMMESKDHEKLIKMELSIVTRIRIYVIAQKRRM